LPHVIFITDTRQSFKPDRKADDEDLNETTENERKRLGRAGYEGNYWISLIRLEGGGCLQVNRLQPSGHFQFAVAP
jgi:hypothetical protein